MKILIFDTETTGLLVPGDPPLEEQPRIIEFGAILIHDGKVIEEYNQLISVDMPLPAIITKITGIKDDDLRGMPRFKDIAKKVISLLEDCDLCIAHNAPFDMGIVNNEFKRISKDEFHWPEAFCTAQEYVPILGYRASMKQLYKHITGEKLAQKHRAIDDCRALWEIIQKGKILEDLE